MIRRIRHPARFVAVVAFVFAANACESRSRAPSNVKPGSSAKTPSGPTARAASSAAAAPSSGAPSSSIGASPARVAPSSGDVDDRAVTAFKDALASRDVRARRAAARTLARASATRTPELLSKALADEDGDVVAWGAFGLGKICRDREADVVRALVARAATLSAAPALHRDSGRFAVGAVDAIADALARCGTTAAEQTLVAWLDGPRDAAESAARALGRLGARRRLADPTVVALLEAAAKPTPLVAALSAFGRMGALSGAARRRLVEVARAAIAAGGDRRTFALRALAAAGADGSDLLAAFVADDRAPTVDRSVAAESLVRIGDGAEAAMASALAALGKIDGAPDTRWLASRFAPLATLLGGMDAPGGANDTLAHLAELAVPPDATPVIARRIVRIRCGAASVLAGHATQSERLVACDPDPNGTTGALAMVRVLDRGRLEKSRFEIWKKLARGGAPEVRGAAFSLVPKHAELPPITDFLVEALSAREPGVVASAARVLYEEPRRAAGEPLERARAREQSKVEPTNPSNADEPPSPSRAIIDALGRAMDADRAPDQIETRVALERAAAALGVLSLKPRVERYCQMANATLRDHAAAALHALGSTNATCPALRPAAAPDVAVPSLKATVALTFVTDAGRLGLTLDPNIAPVDVARIVELARSGFYDGVAVHRVVPGLVVQFGDPGGDGYGGAGRDPLPSETSPLDFGAFAVGLAESGADTGSSQIFVTLSPDPALYGDYPLLGYADPEWATVAEHDVIQRVEIRP